MESDSSSRRSCYDEEDEDEDEEDSLSIKAAPPEDVPDLLLGGLVDVLLEVAPSVVRRYSPFA